MDNKILKFVVIVLILTETLGSLFPGMTYHSYAEGDKLAVRVGKLNSVATQFPFSYYYTPVCFDRNFTREAHNLGEMLTGDFSLSTEYEISMKKDEYCKLLCDRIVHNEYEEHLFGWLIDREYTNSFYLDGLPSGLNYTFANGMKSDRVLYDHGIPVGDKSGEEGKYIVYNHYTFIVFVNKDPKEQKPYSIVEFNIIPWSINHQSNENGTSLLCSKDKHEFESGKNWQVDNNYIPKEGKHLVYSYDVIFYDSDKKWTSRWDHYMLSHKDDNIHWFSFINSTLIILIFTALLGHIFMRALRRDIDNINSRAISDDFIDESGWKQVSNDIFRKPRFSMLLCILTGTGIQLFAMLVITLACGSIGFLSPENRGSLLTLMLMMFVFMGGFAGYWSTRFYKMFGQTQWLKNAIATAILYPSIAFSIFFIINTFLSFEESIGAIPFTTIITLLLLWICCSSPLVLIGAFLAIKKKAMKNPAKVNAVPSAIPAQPWYLELKFICLVTGVLPFGAIFIELIYVMASIWKHYFFSLFGFLFVVIIIMIITSSEISMACIYFQLCKGDYRWWWKSFFISGSVSIYIFGYSIYYYFSFLQMTRMSSIILYYGYMFLASLTIFIISGSIGFISTYFFLKKIYSMIKLD